MQKVHGRGTSEREYIRKCGVNAQLLAWMGILSRLEEDKLLVYIIF